MEHQGDQTKIHFNPDFISRGGPLLNQKVHINPAFLQKSQGIPQTQKCVTPTAPYLSTGHEHHQQGVTSGASRPATRTTGSLLRTHKGNTPTNVYSYSSKSVKDRTIPSSHPKRHSSVYKKCNPYLPYDKSYSRHKDSFQRPNVATKSSAVTKHPSTYSWKASNANSGASHANSCTSLNSQSTVNLRKGSASIIQHYTFPFPSSKYSSVNTSKSFISTTVVRKTCASQAEPQPNTAKPNTSHSTLRSITHGKETQPIRSLVKVAKNVIPIVHSDGIKSETAPSKVVAASCGKATKSISPSLQMRKIKSETKTSNPSTQDAGTLVKREFSNTSHLTKVQFMSSPTASKPVQVTPDQKWVTRNKVVVSSSKKTNQTKVEVRNSIPKTILKSPKQKDDYRIVTKTKLVRTHSSSAAKSKAQHQALTGGRSATQISKPITCTSPRAITISRLQKASPLARLHQAATRSSNKKKYSVLSRTKLVRRQSLSGKAGTPGKPKYSVNTKNKLVRRRSNSGSGAAKLLSYTSESKPKTSKPEAERQKKFHVLSKTKIVRRRSSSGTYKAASTQAPVAASASHSKKRAVVKRHKLVRNVSSAFLKHETSKVNRSFPKHVNTAFKVINATSKLSAKQRIAKGIVSKYKINRLKLESYDGFKKYHKSFDHYRVSQLRLQSANGSERYRRFADYSSKARLKAKFKFQNKKTCASKQSDRFINIGGILYKSTKTSLRKQLPKVKETSVKKPDLTCNVFLRGEKFHLTAGGRKLLRIGDNTPAKASLPRVHLGGLTYSRTRTGLYELTKTHQARAVLSSARQRSMVTLIQKRKKASFQKRNEYCVFFNRFGRCSRKKRGECAYLHDPSRVAICTRFLRGRCPVNNCPFSHTVDPDKMPVCSHFLQAACTREDCPYRHVRVNPAAPVCLDFVKGHCKAGEECDKQHILVCEEFKAGRCPRGTSCPLSHHRGRRRPRKVSFSRDSGRRVSLSMYRKRKRSESSEVLGGPVIKKRVEKKKQEVKSTSSHQRYFHVMAAEETADSDTQNAVDSGEYSDNTEQKVLLEEVSDNTDKSEEAKDPQDETVKDKGTSDDYNTSTSKSVFAETRCRVMRKIDHMKKSYAGFNSDVSEDAGNSEDYKGEPSDSHHVTNTNKDTIEPDGETTASEISAQNCNDAESPDSDTNRVQKPPLPKRLPSYIPLDTM